MDIMLFSTLVLICLVFVSIFYNTITLLNKARKNGVMILLKATKTHENRTMYFTKGKVYKFFRSGDVLIINEDDSDLKYRDNYTFYGDDLFNYFEPTDLLSKAVLKNIKKS